MMRKPQKSSLLVFLFIYSCASCFAQNDIFKSDIELINLLSSQQQVKKVNRPYIYKNESSVIKKFNPAGLLFGGTLYLYQNVLSKHISADCLFIPSCSEFSKQAIKEYSLLKGTILTISRINRCNRIAATDLNHSNIDPETGRYPDPVSRYRKASNENKE